MVTVAIVAFTILVIYNKISSIKRIKKINDEIEKRKKERPIVDFGKGDYRYRKIEDERL